MTTSPSPPGSGDDDDEGAYLGCLPGGLGCELLTGGLACVAGESE